MRVTETYGPSTCKAKVRKTRPAQQNSIANVLVIVFENANANDVLNDAYFGKELTSKGSLLSNYHGLRHPSQPNYIGMISGSTHNCFFDTNIDIEGQTIVDLLEARNLTWKSYQESYPGGCFTGERYETYARKHNPFISFNNIRNNATRCARIVNSDELEMDAERGALPTFMFYTPDMNHDGHDTSVQFSSHWLKEFLEPKLVHPSFASTLFVITYDESLTYFGNHIYTLLLGKGAPHAGSVDGTRYNHYSLLATIEKVFSLGNLGYNDASAAPFKLHLECAPFSNSK
ncbi:hypothetical protein HDU81_005875 [Chytriomyces hyalinus]|nr:hypothetical protein HDU81_005875 [Chytriomyces hyalinus]